MRIKTVVQALPSLALAVMATLPSAVQAQTCASDADCAQGMICHSQNVTTCSGGTTAVKCDPNTLCVAPPTVAPTCTESTVSACTYRYLLPCNADADCGDGFFCQPSVMTSCSGWSGSGSGTASNGGTSAGAGAASGSASASSPPSPSATGGSGALTGPDLPPDVVDGGTSTVECTSSTVYPGTCELKTKSCATDADCPASFTCAAIALPSAATSPTATAVATSTTTSSPSSAGTGGTAGAGTGTATSIPTVPPPATDILTATATGTATGTTSVVKLCQSPYYSSPKSGVDTASTSQGEGTHSGGVDAGAGLGMAPSTVDGGVGTGTTASIPPSPTTDQTAATTSTATTKTTSAGGGGCSVGSGGVPSGAVVLIGLALALAVLGRRRAQG